MEFLAICHFRNYFWISSLSFVFCLGVFNVSGQNLLFCNLSYSLLDSMMDMERRAKSLLDVLIPIHLQCS